MKFRLTRIGEMRGDCTATYDFQIIEDGTVKEFIDEVLANHQGEWGYIGIRSDDSCFGNPRMEYKHGQSIDREALREYEDKQIGSIAGDGGWSRMDYLIKIK